MKGGNEEMKENNEELKTEFVDFEGKNIFLKTKSEKFYNLKNVNITKTSVKGLDKFNDLTLVKFEDILEIKVISGTSWRDGNQ